jgi:hypothetical protein
MEAAKMPRQIIPANPGFFEIVKDHSTGRFFRVPVLAWMIFTDDHEDEADYASYPIFPGEGPRETFASEYPDGHIETNDGNETFANWEDFLNAHN